MTLTYRNDLLAVGEESNFISWAKHSDDKVWIGPDRITDWITDRIKNGSFFAPKPHVVTFKRLCQGLLCSATIDKRKREARMISSVSYFLVCFLFVCLFVFFFNAISCATFPYFNIIYHAREKRRYEVYDCDRYDCWSARKRFM